MPESSEETAHAEGCVPNLYKRTFVIVFVKIYTVQDIRSLLKCLSIKN